MYLVHVFISHDMTTTVFLGIPNDNIQPLIFNVKKFVLLYKKKYHLGLLYHIIYIL